MLTYGAATYTYTANGELLTHTDDTGTTTYTYDLAGNLLRAVLPDGTDITYVTDGQQRRTGKRINGTTAKVWLYSGRVKIVAELDGAGNVISRFAYGSRPNIPDYMMRDGKTYRIIADHLGSPRVVIEAATGEIAQLMSYDEFGRVLADTNPGFQPFGFAGGLLDPDTGFVRFGARDYDPQTGRFTTKDPLGFGGGDTNLYAYVLGDPVNLFDPVGLLAFGISGSETTEIGDANIAAGQQGSVGFGHFVDHERLLKGETRHTTSMGTFESWGSLAYAFDKRAGWPSCDGFIFGAFAGGGANVWLSNAKSVTDLDGPFKTLTFNAAWKTKGISIQYAWGKNAEGDTIGMFSYGLNGAGGGFGASLSLYDTFTWTQGPWYHDD